jgi:hypothetical protein
VGDFFKDPEPNDSYKRELKLLIFLINKFYINNGEI